MDTITETDSRLKGGGFGCRLKADWTFGDWTFGIDVFAFRASMLESSTMVTPSSDSKNNAKNHIDEQRRKR